MMGFYRITILLLTVNSLVAETPVSEAYRWGILGSQPFVQEQLISAIKLSSHSVIREKDYKNDQEVLDDAEIDIVYLAVPQKDVKEWALRAAKAGKHVVCRKLLEITSSSHDDVLKEFEKNNVTFIETYALRYDAIIERASGLIPDPYQVRIYATSDEDVWDALSEGIFVTQRILTSPESIAASHYANRLGAVICCVDERVAIMECKVGRKTPLFLEISDDNTYLAIRELKDDHSFVLNWCQEEVSFTEVLPPFNEAEAIMDFLIEALTNRPNTLQDTKLLECFYDATQPVKSYRL